MWILLQLVAHARSREKNQEQQQQQRLSVGQAGITRQHILQSTTQNRELVLEIFNVSIFILLRWLFFFFFGFIHGENYGLGDDLLDGKSIKHGFFFCFSQIYLKYF